MAITKQVPRGKDHRKYTATQSRTANASGRTRSGRNKSGSGTSNPPPYDAEVNPDETQIGNISQVNAAQNHPKQDGSLSLHDKMEFLTNEGNQVVHEDEDFDGSQNTELGNIDAPQMGRNESGTRTRSILYDVGEDERVNNLDDTTDGSQKSNVAYEDVGQSNNRICDKTFECVDEGLCRVEVNADGCQKSIVSGKDVGQNVLSHPESRPRDGNYLPTDNDDWHDIISEDISCDKIDIIINPIVLTVLMVSNIVGHTEDDFIIDSMSCPINARYINTSRLSCFDEESNLFMQLIQERPGQVSSVFDGSYAVTLTGLKYLPPGSQCCSEEYSPLVSNSLCECPSSSSDGGTYVAVPLTCEILKEGLRKLGYHNVPESKFILVKAFARALTERVLIDNSVESLQKFITDYMSSYCNDTPGLWGVRQLDSKLVEADRKFLRRFIQLNFSKIYLVASMHADGNHRMTAGNNAICACNPSIDIPQSQELVSQYFDSTPHSDVNFAKKVDLYIPTRLNHRLFTQFRNLSLKSQKTQIGGQPSNLLDFYFPVFRNVNEILPSRYIWDHPELPMALSNDIYENPEADPSSRKLNEPFIRQLYQNVGIQGAECDAKLAELIEFHQCQGKKRKDVSVAAHVLGGIIEHTYVKTICQAMSCGSIHPAYTTIAKRYGNIDVTRFSQYQPVAKAIFRSKKKNTFGSYTDGIRPFPFTMNGLEDIGTIFEDYPDPFCDEKKETLFKRELQLEGEPTIKLTQDEVIFVYLLFCSMLSEECNLLLSNFFRGNQVTGQLGRPRAQRGLPTNESVRTYLRAAFFVIRQSVLKSKNIWKKVVFIKLNFAHPIQELHDDVLFLVILRSGVVEGIRWMLYQGISPVLSLQERDMCNDLKMRAKLRRCQCDPKRLNECRCAIPFGDISMYTVLVFSNQMGLHHQANAHMVFKHWLSTHWACELGRIRDLISAEDFEMAQYSGGGTNRRVLSDCISHLSVGGSATLDPRGRSFLNPQTGVEEELNLFNIVRFGGSVSTQKLSIQGAVLTCVISEFVESFIQKERMEIWHSFNEDAGTWKSITHNLASRCPVHYENPLTRKGSEINLEDEEVGHQNESLAVQGPEGDQVEIRVGKQSENSQAVGNQNQIIDLPGDGVRSETVGGVGNLTNALEEHGAVLNQAAKMGEYQNMRSDDQNILQPNQVVVQAEGGVVLQAQACVGDDGEPGEANANLADSTHADDSDDKSVLTVERKIGADTYYSKQKSARFPVNLFTLVEKKSVRGYHTVCRTDWMVIHNILESIEDLRSHLGHPSLPFTETEQMLKVYKKTMKTYEKSGYCVLCQTPKSIKYGKSVKLPLRSYCQNCIDYITRIKTLPGFPFQIPPPDNSDAEVSQLPHVRDSHTSPQVTKKKIHSRMKRKISDDDSHDKSFQVDSGFFDIDDKLSYDKNFLLGLDESQRKVHLGDLGKGITKQICNLKNESERIVTNVPDQDIVVQGQDDMSDITGEHPGPIRCSYCDKTDDPLHQCTACRDSHYHPDCYDGSPYYHLYKKKFGRERGLCSRCYNGKLRWIATCCAGYLCSRLTEEDGKLTLFPLDDKGLSHTVLCCECKGFMHMECGCGDDDLKHLKENGDITFDESNASFCKLCLFDISRSSFS